MSKNELPKNGTYYSNGIVYKTDSLCRIVYFEGDLSLSKAPRDLHAQHTLDGKLLTDDAGHLAASSNGGSGGKENLTPMDRQVNRRDYRAFERENTKLCKEGNRVHLHGNLCYSNDTNRPDAILVNRAVTDGNAHTNTEYFSWTNTDMAQYDGDEFSDMSMDDYPNPMQVADDNGNIVSQATDYWGNTAETDTQAETIPLSQAQKNEQYNGIGL